MNQEKKEPKQILAPEESEILQNLESDAPKGYAAIIITPRDEFFLIKDEHEMAQINNLVKELLERRVYNV